uniref:Uncharacterized protein n=1 Tax=Utricularia reniformis TaxID=192314 RepID=A0A1Y0B1X5_9LAMI|nr:hypothetical protein AEK19_MT1175 [Utricularia reniformis]ART31388.1 hypothetical protein AEK19_MT1175 [Utricularia reniformis]
MSPTPPLGELLFAESVQTFPCAASNVISLVCLS